MMKHIYITIFFTIAFCLNSMNKSYGDNNTTCSILLNLSINSMDIELGEPVNLGFKLINDSSFSVLINNSFELESSKLSLFVENLSTREVSTLNPSYISITYGPSNPIILKAEEFIEKRYDFQFYNFNTGEFIFPRAGKYKIYSTFQYDPQINEKSIRSNVLTINVKPLADEMKDIKALWGRDAAIFFQSSGNWDAGRDKIGKVNKLFPNSRYSKLSKQKISEFEAEIQKANLNKTTSPPNQH